MGTWLRAFIASLTLTSLRELNRDKIDLPLPPLARGLFSSETPPASTPVPNDISVSTNNEAQLSEYPICCTFASPFTLALRHSRSYRACRPMPHQPPYPALTRSEVDAAAVDGTHAVRSKWIRRVGTPTCRLKVLQPPWSGCPLLHQRAPLLTEGATRARCVGAVITQRGDKGQADRRCTATTLLFAIVGLSCVGLVPANELGCTTFQGLHYLTGPGDGTVREKPLHIWFCFRAPPS
jgi:hypothetical protein